MANGPRLPLLGLGQPLLRANLAKAELRAALPKLIDALGDFSIDRDRVVWRQSIVLRGPTELPIRRTTPA